jgi:phospholipid transport system substrate-binding protein
MARPAIHSAPRPGRHHRTAWLAGLALGLLLALSLPAAAELTPPQRVIAEVSDELLRVLREDRDLLARDPGYVHRLVDQVFLPNLDFERACALVLGPFWRDATPAQRGAFSEAFKTLLIQSYASALNRLSAWKIHYPPMPGGAQGDRVLVPTEILQPGRNPVSVDYRMYRKGKRWVAYDVLVEGVSLLAAYRSQFTTIARSKGLDGLIGDLRERNATRR